MSGFHRLHELRMQNDEAGYRMEELRPRFASLANRHEAGTAPRGVSAYQLFQTPPWLAERLVSLLRIPFGSRVLEPSAGLGRLLDALPLQHLVAIESAPQLCAELYRQEREGVRILQRDFLTVAPEEIGLFDAVAMNPPFHMRTDIRHIEHALRFVKPGGRLSAICMATSHREVALRGRSDTWERLPLDTFRETGTNVATVLCTFTV